MISSDDRSSAASGLDVADRLTYLEQRMQMQEDEIQLLKMALADVLKRLNISEEHQAAAAAAGRRPLGAKGEVKICVGATAISHVYIWRFTPICATAFTLYTGRNINLMGCWCCAYVGQHAWVTYDKRYPGIRISDSVLLLFDVSV